MSWYRTSFSELLKAEDPCTTEAEEAFATIIDDIYNRHRPTMITVARAAHEIRRKLGASAFVEVNKLHFFYYNFIKVESDPWKMLSNKLKNTIRNDVKKYSSSIQPIQERENTVFLSLGVLADLY